jgi:hypothetical protein
LFLSLTDAFQFHLALQLLHTFTFLLGSSRLLPLLLLTLPTPLLLLHPLGLLRHYSPQLLLYQSQLLLLLGDLSIHGLLLDPLITLDLLELFCILSTKGDLLIKLDNLILDEVDNIG